PEFADAGALPAVTWLGSWGLAGEQIGKVLFDKLAERRAGAFEVKAPFYLIREKGVIERFGEGNDLAQEALDVCWPEVLVIAAGKVQGQRALAQPFGAESIKVSTADLETFGGGWPIHSAGVEGVEDSFDQLGSGTVSELGFFTTAM